MKKNRLTVNLQAEETSAPEPSGSIVEQRSFEGGKSLQKRQLAKSNQRVAKIVIKLCVITNSLFGNAY